MAIFCHVVVFYQPVDNDDLELVNPALRNRNSAGSSNGGGAVQARGSGAAGILPGPGGEVQQQQQSANAPHQGEEQYSLRQ